MRREAEIPWMETEKNERRSQSFFTHLNKNIYTHLKLTEVKFLLCMQP